VPGAEALVLVRKLLSGTIIGVKAHLLGRGVKIGERAPFSPFGISADVIWRKKYVKRREKRGNRTKNRLCYMMPTYLYDTFLPI
jgi:hypothetical protein